ncbi:Auxin-induced protein 15A [Spatholobus suberectus]|nr:Auxin-induced protein 15A [Spatholobus suberectus]
MDRGGGSRLTGIRQIVRLKEMLQKWQSVTLGPKASNPSSDHATTKDGSISPLINKRVVNVMNCESDEEFCQSPEPRPPPDVPKGYLAVYVGPELRRFIIPTSYLTHSLFKVLLEKAAEEFGFDRSGGLTIPCEIETFKYLLKCMENEQKAHLGQSAHLERKEERKRDVSKKSEINFICLGEERQEEICGETAAGSSGTVKDNTMLHTAEIRVRIRVLRLILSVSGSIDRDNNNRENSMVMVLVIVIVVIAMAEVVVVIVEATTMTHKQWWQQR